MAVQHRTRLTKGITGGLPNVDGDNFRPSDYLIDKLFLQGKEGDLASVMVRAPSIISGLVVSQGVGDTLNITAGSALAFDQQYASVTAHNYDGTALAPAVAIPAYPSVVKNEALTNLAIPSATLNGVAVNYVKALIAEDPVLQRGSEITPAPPYDFLTREILAITVDTVAPTANELVLATFTGVSAGTFTFSSNPDSGQRSYPFGIAPATDTALVSSAGLEYWGFKVSGTLSRTIFKFRNQLNVSDPLFLTVLQDTTTGGSEKSAIAFTRGDYYGAGGETPLLTIGRKNTLVEDSIEHEVTPISRTTAPALGLLGAADGGKWIHRLLSDALDFMGDSTTSTQSLGTGDVTYKSRIYKPKFRVYQNGDTENAGRPSFRSYTPFKATFNHVLTANRIYNYQDKSGTLAHLDDVAAVAAVGVGDIIWKLSRQDPSVTFAFLRLDSVTADLNQLNWPQLVPFLRTVQAYVGGVSSFSFSSFSGTGSVVTLTFAANATNQAMFDSLAEDLAVHGGVPSNWRSITIPATVNDLVAGDYAINAIDPILLTIDISSAAVTTGAGSAEFYPYRIATDTTKARWFIVEERVLITPSATKVANLRRRYRQVKHGHSDTGGHNHSPSAGGSFNTSLGAIINGGVGAVFTAPFNYDGATTAAYIAVDDPTDSGTGAGVPLLANQNEAPSLVGFAYIFGGSYVP